MYTNQMRMTGLSGIDTESMVKQLMKAESMKLTKMYQSKTKNVWKQEAFHAVSKELTTLQNKFLSFTNNTKTNIRSTSNFTGLTSTVKISGGSDSTAISVRPDSTAKLGTYQLEVEKVAQKDAYRSATPISSDFRSAGAFDLSKLKGGDTIGVALDGGTAKNISFTQAELDSFSDSDQFATALNTKLATAFGSDAGGQKVSAKIDTATNQLVISAGKGHSARIAEGGSTVNKVLAGSFPIPTGPSSFDITVGSVTKTITVDEITDTDDATALAKKLNAAMTEAFKDEAVKSGVSFSVADGKIQLTNANATQSVQITDSGLLSNAGFGGTFATEQTVLGSSALDRFGMTAGSTSLDPKKTIGELFGSSLQDMGGGVKKAVFTINGHTFNFDSTEKLSDVMNQVNTKGIGVNMTFDSMKGEFNLESTNTGELNAITLADEPGSSFLSNGLKLTNHYSVAQDAAFTFNGVTTSRESNNFSMEGFNITLTADAEGKTFDIGTSKNASESIELIKNFVTDYNAMVKYLNDQVSIPRPKTSSSSSATYYEPLTDEQKKDMKESEIKVWEEKAKKGMLYRDQTVSNIQSQLRTMLYQPVELPDGRKISLHEIGITTSSKLTESGQLQIDEAKLQKALEERGDDVAQLFTKSSDVSGIDKTKRRERIASEGIAERLNDIINWETNTTSALYEKAGSADNRSKNTLGETIKQQDDKIAEMLSYLARRETYYYSMFSKMEAAMTQANSQMASLQSMLGL